MRLLGLLMMSFQAYITAILDQPCGRDLQQLCRAGYSYPSHLLLLLIWMGKEGLGRVSSERIVSLVRLCLPVYQLTVAFSILSKRLSSDHLELVKECHAMQEILTLIEYNLLQDQQIQVPRGRRSKMTKLGDACANLTQCFRVLGIRVGVQQQKVLESLLVVSFDALEAQEVSQYWQAYWKRFQLSNQRLRWLPSKVIDPLAILVS
jgi:hypothetical protein